MTTTARTSSRCSRSAITWRNSRVHRARPRVVAVRAVQPDRGHPVGDLPADRREFAARRRSAIRRSAPQRLEHALGQLGSADDEVGQPRVAGRCRRCGEPSSRLAWKPCSERDRRPVRRSPTGTCRRRGRRCRLRPCTTDIALAPADPSRTASQSRPSATSTAAYGARLREVTRRGRSRVNGGIGVRIVGGEACGRSPAGSRRRRAKRSPVQSAMWTAQSMRPGSLNSRVPSSGSTIHTRSASNRRGSSRPSSESTASSGRCDGELLGEELLRERVAGILDVPGRGALGEQLLAGFEEQVARLGRQARGELAVGLLHRASLPADGQSPSRPDCKTGLTPDVIVRRASCT